MRRTLLSSDRRKENQIYIDRRRVSMRRHCLQTPGPHRPSLSGDHPSGHQDKEAAGAPCRFYAVDLRNMNPTQRESARGGARNSQMMHLTVDEHQKLQNPVPGSQKARNTQKSPSLLKGPQDISSLYSLELDRILQKIHLRKRSSCYH